MGGGGPVLGLPVQNASKLASLCSVLVLKPLVSVTAGICLDGRPPGLVNII